jgi:hypothetical protein
MTSLTTGRLVATHQAGRDEEHAARDHLKPADSREAFLHTGV